MSFSYDREVALNFIKANMKMQKNDPATTINVLLEVPMSLPALPGAFVESFSTFNEKEYLFPLQCRFYIGSVEEERDAASGIRLQRVIISAVDPPEATRKEVFPCIVPLTATANEVREEMSFMPSIMITTDPGPHGPNFPPLPNVIRVWVNVDLRLGQFMTVVIELTMERCILCEENVAQDHYEQYRCICEEIDIQCLLKDKFWTHTR